MEKPNQNRLYYAKDTIKYHTATDTWIVWLWFSQKDDDSSDDEEPTVFLRFTKVHLKREEAEGPEVENIIKYMENEVGIFGLNVVTKDKGTLIVL